MIDYQFMGFLVFVFFLSVFLYYERKKIVMQKFLFPLLYFAMYKSRVGLNFMDIVAKKFSRPLKYLAYVGIVAGFLGMIFIAYTLIINVYNLLTVPSAAAGVGLVLPFKVKGSFYVPFFYWIISIFIIAVVHEFSHGVIARVFGIKIKSSGFAFLGILLPILPAAFVEPDEKQINKASKKAQLSIYAAGPFSNILLAAIVLGIFFAAISPLSNAIYNPDGVLVSDLMGSNDSFPAGAAGIEKGELILSVDNTPTLSVDNFTSVMDSKRSGDTILITTNVSQYNVTLAESPNNSSKGYLGVYIGQSFDVKEDFAEKYGTWFLPIISWFIGLFYWLFLLNLGIGLFNLVPLGPIDGGRMLLTTLKHYISEKKAHRIWSVISTFFLILIIVNIGFAFIK